MPAVRGHLPRPFDPMTVEVWRSWPLEEEIEAGIVRRLGRVDGRLVERQVDCCGHKPDIVTLWTDTYTIVEVKREVIGARALDQVERYVDHWVTELADARERFVVYGILAAPAIRPGVRGALRQAGIAYLPIILSSARAA